MEYAWVARDRDRDGLLEDEQHNTYDIEFFGPNSMLSGFYPGALEAGARMAEAVGDRKAAARYRQVLGRGQKNYQALLWNGEFFIQKYDWLQEKKYQYGQGCLSDKLLGQWLAMAAGVGRFLDKAKIEKTLESIYRYNFKDNFYDFANMQRTYALADEKGLLLCTWPRGGRPPLPFPYSDEVWTGIEYHVASHLIYQGMVKEGLTIVKAVRERCDGWRRNPWNEVECGHHYARAMSSWGLLLALSGFNYSAPEGRLGFAPFFNQEDFRTFWSPGSAWGTYEQHPEGDKVFSVRLNLEHGDCHPRELNLELPRGFSSEVRSISCTPGGKNLRVQVMRSRKKVTLKFRQPVPLKAGESLTLRIFS